MPAQSYAYYVSSVELQVFTTRTTSGLDAPRVPVVTLDEWYDVNRQGRSGRKCGVKLSYTGNALETKEFHSQYLAIIYCCACSRFR